MSPIDREKVLDELDELYRGLQKVSDRVAALIRVVIMDDLRDEAPSPLSPRLLRQLTCLDCGAKAWPHPYPGHPVRTTARPRVKDAPQA